MFNTLVSTFIVNSLFLDGADAIGIAAAGTAAGTVAAGTAATAAATAGTAAAETATVVAAAASTAAASGASAATIATASTMAVLGVALPIFGLVAMGEEIDYLDHNDNLINHFNDMIDLSSYEVL